MYKYRIQNIVPSNEAELNVENLTLWVLHVNKIPPHIGISKNKQFFSLKANGKDENKSLQSLLDIVIRKGIKTLGFRLMNDVPLSRIEEVFSRYDRTVSGQVTCLNPIKMLLDTPDANLLMELLDELYERKAIMEVVGFGVDEKFEGIPVYKKRDIDNRLRLLENE